ncbi:hypothetical protein DFJ73DRAFT_961132 [Zopfochytrium polystomum]|nr:hypothetical protein DFJ73DRAFT_961132 [Zopfochytrium polystomum]
MSTVTVPYVTSDGKCLYLDDQSPCGPQYYGYPVATSVQVASLGFSDYASFVARMNSFVNATNVGSSFASQYSCQSTPSYDLQEAVSAMRYQMTYYCGNYVLATLANKLCDLLPVAGTTLHPYGPLICQPSCDAASKWYSGIILNSTVCTNQTITASKVQSFEKSCNQTASFTTNNDNFCVTGLTGLVDELDFCGYRSKELALKHCPTETDTCCKNFLAANPTSSSITSSSTSSSLPSSSSQNNAASASNSPAPTTSSGANISVIAPIVAGGVALLIACAVAAFLVTKRRRSQQESKNAPLSYPHQDGPYYKGNQLNAPAAAFGGPNDNNRHNMNLNTGGSTDYRGPTSARSAGNSGFGLVSHQPNSGMSPGGGLGSGYSNQDHLNFAPYSANQIPSASSYAYPSNTALPAPVSAPLSAHSQRSNQYNPPTPSHHQPQQPYQPHPGIIPLASSYGAASSADATFGTSASNFGSSASSYGGFNNPVGVSGQSYGTGTGAAHQNIPAGPAPSYEAVAASMASGRPAGRRSSIEKPPILLSTTSTRSPGTTAAQNNTAYLPPTSADAATAAPAAVAGPPSAHLPPSPAVSNTTTPSITSSTQSSPLVMRVLHPYTPTLADELELIVGQEVVVLRAFDDGWGLGMTPYNGAQGAFPLVCVTSGVSSASESGSVASESLSSLAPEERDKHMRLSAMIQRGAARSGSVNR